MKQAAASPTLPKPWIATRAPSQSQAEVARAASWMQ